MRIKKLFYSILLIWLSFIWLCSSFSSANFQDSSFYYIYSFKDISFSADTYNSSFYIPIITPVDYPATYFICYEILNISWVDLGDYYFTTSNNANFVYYATWWYNDFSWSNIYTWQGPNSQKCLSYPVSFKRPAYFNPRFKIPSTSVIDFDIKISYQEDTLYSLSDYLPLNWLSSSSDCSQDSDYLQCIENLNIKNWQVATLSWDLSSCQSSLSSCQNGFDVSYQACIENLSWCSSDLENMTNYNTSLSDQLNECLAELPIPCEWTWCEDTINTNTMFSFFWEHDEERFSLPVANNVFLPQWFRAYVDSWVVAIWKYDEEKTYITIDDESFERVNNAYFYFFSAIIWLWLFALFLWFFKGFLTPYLNPKNKS